uniref:Uncharacterized protein n=1 Tax=Knipowitschia caucasica TaxID=637954 RepID=A0AAV2M2J9_KNICA
MFTVYTSASSSSSPHHSSSSSSSSLSLPPLAPPPLAPPPPPSSSSSSLLLLLLQQQRCALTVPAGPPPPPAGPRAAHTGLVAVGSCGSGASPFAPCPVEQRFVHALPEEPEEHGTGRHLTWSRGLHGARVEGPGRRQAVTVLPVSNTPSRTHARRRQVITHSCWDTSTCACTELSARTPQDTGILVLV